MDLFPIPPEPDLHYAQALCAAVTPIFEGASQYEWAIGHPKYASSADVTYSRHPTTKELVHPACEVRVRLALLFMQQHYKGVAFAEQQTHPAKFAHDLFLQQSKLPQWVLHEKRLRVGPATVPSEMDPRIGRLIEGLSALSPTLRLEAIHVPQSEGLPPDEKYFQALQSWYHANCQAIVAGWHDPIIEGM